MALTCETGETVTCGAGEVFFGGSCIPSADVPASDALFSGISEDETAVVAQGGNIFVARESKRGIFSVKTQSNGALLELDNIAQGR